MDCLFRPGLHFGMDAVVWFTGVDGAVTMSMTEPEAFQRLINIIEATDYATD